MFAYLAITNIQFPQTKTCTIRWLTVGLTDPTSFKILTDANITLIDFSPYYN
jgi:hypothetical protein